MAEKTHAGDTVPFYPNHVSIEFRVVIGVLVIIAVFAIIGLFNPLGLGDPADPLDTPLHVKPEWYFLALYQLLKYIPKTVGAVAPVLAILLLVLLPFIDRKPDHDRRIYRYRLIGVVIGMLILIALTIWGELS